MNLSQTAILIPAYNPDERLTGLVRELAEHGFATIAVVNDGSTTETAARVFAGLEQEKLCLIRTHALNMGKGAALKLGLDCIYSRYPQCPGVITVDADGQHCIADILNVARERLEHPDALILGTRCFDEAGIPFRSRIGNKMTRLLMRLFLGIAIRDTQTGLRAIPRRLIPELLNLASNRYEFELEMLILAKHRGVPIREIAIRTIYLNGNESSHFNPLLDSVKIYFVLFRYILSSAATALFDYLVFLLVLPLTGGSILLSTYLSRAAALCVNYTLVRNLVFDSRTALRRTFPLYLLLVCISGFLSAMIVMGLKSALGLDERLGKLLAETVLYLINFLIQRDFIFRSPESLREPGTTDWDSYYSAPAATAGYARNIVAGKLMEMLRKFRPAERFSLAELGGGNSCFFDRIEKEFLPLRYTVYDSNALGIRKFRERTEQRPDISIRELDLLNCNPDGEEKSDIVLSVGLIEHFMPENTARMIRRHFELAKDGGIVILFFPTPTLLYRTTRSLAELLRVWIFHDERPLDAAEVETAVVPYGTILHKEIIWSNFLTQQIIIARKNQS